MAYDIAHMCVADLGQVMIPCVYIHVKRNKGIRTFEVHMTTKFVITNESQVRF